MTTPMTIDAWTLLGVPGRDEAHGRTLFGPLHTHRGYLRAMNELGYNVFWTVNGTDGQGRRAENVHSVRYVFADYDHGLPAKFALEPSTLVQSSPGKFQAYWQLQEPSTDITKWQRIMRALVTSTGADRNAQDVARILRVPGFLNHKYEPAHKVSKVGGSEQSYTLGQLALAFGELEVPRIGAGCQEVSEEDFPPVAVRLKRWTGWLDTILEHHGWPRAGERNGELFAWAAKGVRDFAVPADDVEDILQDLWDVHEESGDGRIHQIVSNALRSGSNPFGAAYATPRPTFKLLDENNK